MRTPDAAAVGSAARCNRLACRTALAWRYFSVNAMMNGLPSGVVLHAPRRYFSVNDTMNQPLPSLSVCPTTPEGRNKFKA